MLRRPSLLVGSLIALVGCASIFSSGPTSMRFASDPAGAEVLVNGEPLGTTPVELELHADQEYIVTFRRDGCQDTTVPLETHVQAGFVVLDILAGLIGVVVDAATGEWREFDDNNPFVRLDCGTW